MFGDYFIDRSGAIDLENLHETYWDHDGNRRLRNWVRAKWPRKISKILGSQSLERTFSFRTPIPPMSDSDDDTPARRRKRHARNRVQAVCLTDMPAASDESSESECEPVRQRYDPVTKTIWVSGGPGASKTPKHKAPKTKTPKTTS